MCFTTPALLSTLLMLCAELCRLELEPREDDPLRVDADDPPVLLVLPEPVLVPEVAVSEPIALGIDGVRG